jgi:hypothetical protein
MLSVTSTGGGMQLYGVGGGFGATAEMHRILGVPFWWERILFGYREGYKLVEHVGGEDGKAHFNVIYVSKSKTPKALAAAIDQVLAKASADLLKKDPSLAANPKELLKRAKGWARLVPSADSKKLIAVIGEDAGGNAFLGYLNSVNKLPTPSRSIFVREEGDRWRIKLKDRPSGSSIPGVDLLADVVEGIAKGISATISTTVNFATEGFEWALNQIEKLACAAAKSDLVKGAAATYATGQGGPAAGAATTAAINAASSKFCSSGAAPPKAPPKTPPPKIVVPWYKRPSTYVVGGVLATGTIAVLALRKR